MIEIEHLYKSFEGKTILQDITTCFDQGKANMVIGASGSGKTVFMKCVIGLVNPDHGRILYDGKDFTGMTFEETRSIRSEIGMLFQGSALFDSKTVEENVGFPLEIFTNKSKSEIRERVNSCLKRVNLVNANHLYPAEISGGMQKRVGIARAISLNPKYLFCDEPNSGLDPKTASVIDALIKEITEEYNITTVINTHDMHSMYTIGDKVIFLHKGVKRYDGKPEDIKNAQVRELDEMIDPSLMHQS
jgi:phospholipid/cholesterol/gamma-HCH transport system ATP-binding protein